MKKIVNLFIAILFSYTFVYSATIEPESNTSGVRSLEKQNIKQINETKKQLYQTALNAYKQGLAYEKEGNYKKAFYEYQKVLQTKIKYPQIYKRIGMCYYYFGNYEYAIKYFRTYLNYFPNDNAIKNYIPKLEQQLKFRETKYLESTAPVAEFKSPLSAVLFSHIDLLPPAVCYQGYGNFYSRNRGQNWIPASSSMSLLGTFAFAGGFALQENSKSIDPLFNSLYGLGAYLMSSAFIYDLLSSPFIATESSKNFIYHAKTNNVKLQENKVDYKDPAFTAMVSLLGGSIVPGAGHFFAGDNDTAIKLLITTPLIAGTTCGVGLALTNNDDENTKQIGKYVLWSGVGVYGIMRLIDLYGSLLHCDKVSEEYYKQLVNPNSKFVLKEKKEEKEPWIAFLISLIPVPGSGNFYAENYWTAGTLAGCGIASAITYFAIPDNNDTLKILKYSFLGIAGLTKLYDIFSAPGYTEIYNAVYTNRQEREKTAKKQQNVFLSPAIFDNNSLGLSLSYNF
ncbi:MAG: tetratricopeptide repeat protein [Candidatus Goldbacteria bacterium]|nr:tetratricopeptide repeat protein [Candidatus Goldiibacteriota bacterium]